MRREELKKYLEAVELVCSNCVYASGYGDFCDYCPVTKMADFHVEMSVEEENDG